MPAHIYSVAMTPLYRMGPALLQSSDDGTAHAPDTFRSALLRALDSRSRVAVALTSRAGLRWLLTEWPDAALQLTVRPVGAELPDTSVLRKMHRASQWFPVRGDKPMSVTLRELGLGSSNQGYWQVVVAALGSGHAHSGLGLGLQLQHIPASLLQLVGSAFAGLTTVSLGSVSGAGSAVKLPPTTTLKALRHLTIHRVSADSQAALWSSVAPYLPQLTSLTITGQPTEPQWSELIRAARPSTTLTHLSLPCALGPELSQLLQQGLPEVAQLTFTGVYAHASESAAAPPACSWHTLHLSGDLYGSDLAWLPMPAQGKLVIEFMGKESKTITLHAPTAQKVASKLTRIEFRGSFTVGLGVSSPFTHERLAAAIAALSPLRSQCAELSIDCCDMCAEVATALHAVAGEGWARLSLRCAQWPTVEAETDRAPFTLPPLHMLELSEDCILDNSLLSELRRCVTLADVLYVEACRLKTALPEGTSLPWKAVQVPSIGVSDLVAQAQLLGTSTAWRIDADLDVMITEQEVELGAHLSLAAQLSRVNVTYIDSVFSSCGKETDQPKMLRANLAVLRALPCQAGVLSILTWSATPAVIAELRGLPAWSGTLDLRLRSGEKLPMSGQWPVARAPQLIPRSYRAWRICCAALDKPDDSEQVAAFILNAPSNRTESEPLRIEVTDRTELWVAGVREQMESDGSYPYVSVVPY